MSKNGDVPTSGSAARAVLAPPNGVLGVVGGGQLGRMLAMAAARLGLKTHIFAPSDDCPAADCAARIIVGSYDDETALRHFAEGIDVATYEFENVPAETVRILTNCGVVVSPGVKALETAQDRLFEKRFAASIGGETAPYHPVDDIADLEEGLSRIGTPAILKTRRLGYDGKGQTRIGAAPRSLDETWEDAKRRAWDEIGARPSILEGHIDFSAEFSIIGARGYDGEIRLYDAPENRHAEGILRSSAAPAQIASSMIEAAAALTKKMLAALDYVGVIGVEFFAARDGRALVNEFAPRVHNSGHWTIDACACSQFEQHVRAVCGWPLGDPARHSDAVMTNLIGSDVDEWPALAREPRTSVHLYRKGAPSDGRKMGHATRIAPLGGRG